MSGDLVRRADIFNALCINVQEAGRSNGRVSHLAETVLNIPAAEAVEVVRCRDCWRFMEYRPDYVPVVEGANGDCLTRKIYSDGDNQFSARRYEDYCSDGRRRDAVD